MFNINSISQDKTDSGTWTEYNGGEFLIAHTSSLSFQREFNRLQTPYRKQIDRGKLDPKISLEILCKSMAHSLLLDWRNVGTGDEELQYSKETAYTVLVNNEDLRDFVQEFSMDLDNFRTEQIEEAGNS